MLAPKEENTGYRRYGEQELFLLQQILYYRERGSDLKTIQQILYQIVTENQCTARKYGAFQ